MSFRTSTASFVGPEEVTRYDTMTMKPTTNSAIWMEEPMATPMEISMRFFIAKITADACSAALPAMGITITPMNTLDTPQLFDASYAQ